MSEISKLYENAGIKSEWRYTVHQFCHFYECDKEDILRNKHLFKERKTARIKKAEKKYPPFTAEKQIELIKWLGKLDGKLEIFCTYNKEKFIFNFYFNRKTNKNPDPKYSYSNLLNEDFEILIASLINDLWQDLTEEEKQQVKGILE